MNLAVTETLIFVTAVAVIFLFIVVEITLVRLVVTVPVSKLLMM